MISAWQLNTDLGSAMYFRLVEPDGYEDKIEVEKMFEATETAGRDAKREIFLEIKIALEAHAWIEEAIFYPTLQSLGDGKLIEMNMSI